MKVTDFEGSATRRILIGMITSDVVCSRISNRWKGLGLFDSDWANQIGTWCVQYLRESHHAPRQAIQVQFEKWAHTTESPPEMVKAVESFLAELDEQYERDAHALEDEDLLKVAEDLFTQVRLEEELDLADREIEKGLIDDAVLRLSKTRKIDFTVASYVSPFEDKGAFFRAFERDDQRPLVHLNGGDAVQHYFDGAFKRGEFYSFMGPDKTGKTSHLINFAVRALWNKNKVAFFDCGDSIQEEVLMRFACRIQKAPVHAGTYMIPTEYTYDEDTAAYTLQQAEERFKEASPSKPLQWARKRKFDPDILRLSCHANSTLTVEELSNILTDWGKDGWFPDVVILDYADIMAAPPGFTETQEVDEIWKGLRRISQQFDCLLVTATQSNAVAYGERNQLLGPQHFSGRKTKMAHVNGMIGINVTNEERRMHECRLNWVVRRKARQATAPYVTVAGNYFLENPYMISR